MEGWEWRAARIVPASTLALVREALEEGIDMIEGIDTGSTDGQEWSTISSSARNKIIAALALLETEEE